MNRKILLLLFSLLLAACTGVQASPTAALPPTDAAQPNLPNPASVYCEQSGYKLEIRTAADGSQSGFCIFPDGSACEEWALFNGECAPATQATPGAIGMPNPAAVFCEQSGYKLEIRTAADGSQSGFCIFPDGSACEEWALFNGECAPTGQSAPTAAAPALPTPLPVDPADYEGWWTYTNTTYGFSLLIPPDWVVDDTAAGQSLLQGHLLMLHPQEAAASLSLRVTFRSLGEDTLLWPSGVGNGEFMPQGSLEVAGEPVERLLLVCPGGQVSAVWFHGSATQPNIQRGNLEFGFILGGGDATCQSDISLAGKAQHLGEMIIASLSMP